LIRDDKVFQQILLCKVEWNSELKRIQSPQAVRKTVSTYEKLRRHEMIFGYALHFDVACGDVGSNRERYILMDGRSTTPERTFSAKAECSSSKPKLEIRILRSGSAKIEKIFCDPASLW
jgi:hypothetical protein